MPKRLCLLFFSTFVFSACSTMSSKQCAVADWSAIGYADGQQGRLLQYRNERALDCAKHDIQLDQSEYNRGRERGLQQYCTEQKGFELGKNDRRYNGVCVNHSEDTFIAAHKRGRKYAQFKRALTLTEDKINAANKELDALGAELRDMLDRGINLNSQTSSELESAVENRQRAVYLEELFIPYWYEQNKLAELQLAQFEQRLASNEQEAMRMRPPSFAAAPEPDEYFALFHALTELTRELFPDARTAGEHYVFEACAVYQFANEKIQRLSTWQKQEQLGLIHDELLSALAALKTRPEYKRLFRDSFREENMAIKTSRHCPRQYNRYRREVRGL